MTYMGQGLVDDMDTAGRDVVPLDTYLQPKYRLALFRSIFATGESITRSAAWKKVLADLAMRQKGRPYDYIGAIRAGIHSASFNSPKKMTPNALIRRGHLVPIVVA